MGEDYKKIVFEDVKVGQKVRIVFDRSIHYESFTGIVHNIDPSLKEITLRDASDMILISPEESESPDILLLEEAPKVIHCDTSTPLNLTMTVLPSGSVTVESDQGESYTFLSDTKHGGLTYFEDTGTLRFASVEHWQRHEPRLRGKRLKDSDGDVWAYIDGKWKYLEVDGWYDDVPIGYYVVDGFTIVDSLD